MKKFLISAAMFCFGMACSAFNVIVNFQDGNTKVYDSNSISKMDWVGNGEVVMLFADGNQVSLDADTFSYLSFEGAESKLSGPTSDSSGLRIEGKTVIAASPVSVHDISGKQVASSPTGILSLEGLSSGIYVISTNKESAKILITTK